MRHQVNVSRLISNLICMDLCRGQISAFKLETGRAGPKPSAHARQGKVQVSVSALAPARRKTRRSVLWPGSTATSTPARKPRIWVFGGEERAQDPAGRRGRDRLDHRRVAHVIRQVAAGEIDEEARRARRGRRIGRAQGARRDAERPDGAAGWRQALIHRERRDAIAVGERLARVEPVLRRPGDDDVVVALVAGRQLDQLHPALAPAFVRLDPVARPQFVGEIEILVVAEVAVALQETEPARVGVEKGRDARRRPGC